MSKCCHLLLLLTRCVNAVPSSSPVNVPRRRTSASEERAVSNAASVERSLLSQQIRLNSDNSLSVMTAGGGVLSDLGSVQSPEPQAGSSHQSFLPMSAIKRESVDEHGGFLSSGWLSGTLQNGSSHEGFGAQASAESQSHMKRVPSVDWQPQVLPSKQLGQVSNALL